MRSIELLGKHGDFAVGILAYFTRVACDYSRFGPIGDWHHSIPIDLVVRGSRLAHTDIPLSVRKPTLRLVWIDGAIFYGWGRSGAEAAPGQSGVSPLFASGCGFSLLGCLGSFSVKSYLTRQ